MDCLNDLNMICALAATKAPLPACAPPLGASFCRHRSTSGSQKQWANSAAEHSVDRQIHWGPNSRAGDIASSGCLISASEAWYWGS